MKNDIPWFAIILVGLLVYAFVPAVQTGVNGIFSAAPMEEQEEPEETFCADPSVTMTIGPMAKMYAPATSVAAEYARVFVGDFNNKMTDKGLKADSTTLAVSWKDDIAMYYAAGGSTYYQAESKFAVPCKPTIDSANYDGDSHKLYEYDQSTNLNFMCFNYLDSTKNADSSAEEAIGVAGNPNFACSVQGKYEDAFSPFGKVYVTVKYNSTAYDVVDFVPNTAGFTVSDGSTPSVRSNAAAAAGYSLKTFVLNKGLISNERLDFTIDVLADDTLQPIAGGPGDITIYFDDEEWYQNSKTGIMEFGPEDDDDADVGDTVNTGVIYVS